MKALGSMVGESSKKEEKNATTDEVKGLADSAKNNKASIKVNRPSGEKIEVDARSNKEEETTEEPE